MPFKFRDKALFPLVAFPFWLFIMVLTALLRLMLELALEFNVMLAWLLLELVLLEVEFASQDKLAIDVGDAGFCTDIVMGNEPTKLLVKWLVWVLLVDEFVAWFGFSINVTVSSMLHDILINSRIYLKIFFFEKLIIIFKPGLIFNIKRDLDFYLFHYLNLK